MLLSSLRIVLIAVISAVIATLASLVGFASRSGRAFHALARFYGRVVLAVSGVVVEVRGLERADFSRRCVYVANHASFFDIPAVLVGIPDQIRIVYRKSLERIPFFGWGLKFGGTYVGLERENSRESIEGLDEAARKIRDGASVLLFAEGTRSADGTLQPFKRGPFRLAVRAGVPIVPVAISGSYNVLPRNSFRIRPGTITLTLGERIESSGGNGKGTEIALRDRVHDIIQNNLRQ